jgi:hypothetical protein
MQNKLVYIQSFQHSTPCSLTLLVITLIHWEICDSVGLLNVWIQSVPAIVYSCFEVCQCLILFPDKCCNVMISGISAVNMLYQYPIWSLSQSAEITFMMFLFCWYVWDLKLPQQVCCYSINVPCQMLMDLHFVFIFVFISQNIFVLGKVHLVVKKCANMRYEVLVFRHDWKQDEFTFKHIFWNNLSMWNVGGMTKYGSCIML